MNARLSKMSVLGLLVGLFLFSCNSVKNSGDTTSVSEKKTVREDAATSEKDNTSSHSNTSTSGTKVWYNWAEGYAYAKKNNKIILVDAYTDWCGWCKVMDKKTYTNSDIQNALKKDFVSIKINPEKGTKYKIGSKSYSGMELLNFLAGGRFGRSYPTTLFWLDVNQANEGKKTYQQIGYLNPSQMKTVLKKMVTVKQK
jgi:thioredoxin-related protein